MATAYKCDRCGRIETLASQVATYNRLAPLTASIQSDEPNHVDLCKPCHQSFMEFMDEVGDEYPPSPTIRVGLFNQPRKEPS